jgi:hypothetical protein
VSGPIFNPVVRNGLFQVSYGGFTKSYRRTVGYEAKYALLNRIGVEATREVLAECQVVELEPTKRRFK